MKNIPFTLLLLLLISFKRKVNDFYQVSVRDQNDNPLEGVSVIEEDRNEQQTRTDENGYFKLDINPDWLRRLIFTRKGYAADTIPSVWHQAGETIEYNFIENDTTIVRLKVLGITN